VFIDALKQSEKKRGYTNKIKKKREGSLEVYL